MASIVFDKRRGTYLIQWYDGLKYARNVVHQLSGWKVETSKRPARDPADVTRSLADYQDREKAAKARAGKTLKDKSLGGFIRGYQERYARINASGSTTQLEYAVDHFMAWCKTAKIDRIDQVTSAVCRKWIETRAGETSKKTKKPIEYATLVKEKALLMAAWSEAVKHEEIDRNPWMPVEIPAREIVRKRGSWSPEQYVKLLEVCRPWIRDIITVGCHTGIRITALLGLEWRDIQWSSDGGKGLGIITIRAELNKRNKGYTVPLHPIAHDVLARRRAMLDSDRVLTGEQGRPSTSVITGNSIIRACSRAGLKKPDSPNHTMRRSFGRWAVLGHLTGQPVPLYVVSRWMDHSTVETTMEYLDMKQDESIDWMTGDGKGGDQS